jgi:hypothetical protein
MIILVQDDPAGDAVECAGVFFKLLVHVSNGHFLCPFNVFPYLGYTEAAFII